MRLNLSPHYRLRYGLLIVAVIILMCLRPAPSKALPSFARQTGQQCAACHIGGNWPQLTPWGRFFKLSGYAAGKKLIGGRDGFNYVPVGLFGQVGTTFANQPNDSQGQSVISPNGGVQAYEFTGLVATKFTDFMGVFYEYQLGNEFPGWKGSTGAADFRAVHFFHPGGQEVLVGFDMNNAPTLQDVWNTLPNWGYPFFTSPQAVSTGPASPMIEGLGGQAASVGVYALWNRKLYGEISMYRVATGFFRWMSGGTSFTSGGANYLESFNPYWRVYWTEEHGPNVFMVGTFGMHSNVYPNSAAPNGPTNAFTDYGFDTQYDYMGGANKVSLRFAWIHEDQSWNAGYPQGASSTPGGNINTINLNGTYTLHNHWAINAGYFANNGSNNAALYAVTTPSGAVLSTSPNTNGYTLELDRTLTQNLKVTAQYAGFFKYNGLKSNIDGMGRSPGDNNTMWLSLFMAF